jgi:hypothetical protein
MLVKHKSHPSTTIYIDKLKNILLSPIIAYINQNKDATIHQIQGSKPSNSCALLWDHIGLYKRWKIQDDTRPHIFGIELKALISYHMNFVGPSSSFTLLSFTDRNVAVVPNTNSLLLCLYILCTHVGPVVTLSRGRYGCDCNGSTF